MTPQPLLLSFTFNSPVRALVFSSSLQRLHPISPESIRIPFTTFHSNFQALIFLSMISFSFNSSYTMSCPIWYPNFVSIKIPRRYAEGSQWTSVQVNPQQGSALRASWSVSVVLLTDGSIQRPEQDQCNQVLQNFPFLIEGDESARYYSKPFIYINSLSPYNHSMRKVLYHPYFTNEEAGVQRH